MSSRPPWPTITALCFRAQYLWLYYHPRYYDPAIARFIRPGSIVQGSAARSGGRAATVGSGGTSALTVDFHEPSFVSQLNQQNAATARQGFWF
ncbi:MAG: hypothetical protein NVS2B7_16400 [Herpetosiphon sp.]